MVKPVTALGGIPKSGPPRNKISVHNAKRTVTRVKQVTEKQLREQPYASVFIL